MIDFLLGDTFQWFNGDYFTALFVIIAVNLGLIAIMKNNVRHWGYPLLLGLAYVFAMIPVIALDLVLKFDTILFPVLITAVALGFVGIVYSAIGDGMDESWTVESLPLPSIVTRETEYWVRHNPATAGIDAGVGTLGTQLIYTGVIAFVGTIIVFFVTL